MKTEKILIGLMLFYGILTGLVGQELSRIEIHEDEIDRELDRIIIQNQMSGKEFKDDELPLLRENIREGILMRKLLVSLSIYREISIGQDEIDSALKQTRGDYPQTEWLDILLQQGYTEESFRDVIEESLLIDRVLEKEVLNNITVSREEIETYYTEHPQEFTTNYGTIPLREVQDLIKQNLLTVKGQQEVSRFMEELYAKAMFVEKE